MRSIWSVLSRYLLMAFAAVLLSISFNNCAGFSADPLGEANSLQSTSLDSSGSCIFNGVTYGEGASILAYLTSSVSSGQTCARETRTCHNGSMTGSFPYASCEGGIPAACLFNGQTIQSGQGISAYTVSSVPSGQSCASYVQFRGCTDGILSGTASYANCQVDQPASCLFNGQTVQSGQGITAYTVSSVPAGQSCSGYAQFRGCTDGILSGTAPYASCQVAQPASCLLGGQTVPSGGNIVAYQNSSVPSGQPCAAETRNCSNGTLSGSFTATSCTMQRCTVLTHAVIGYDGILGFGLAKDVDESDCGGFCSSFDRQGVCMYSNRNVGRRCTFYAFDVSLVTQVAAPPGQDIKTAICH